MEKEKTNKAMDMKISNNHIVFEVETNAGKKNVLLDTGAIGFTPSFDPDVDEIIINGRLYPAFNRALKMHPNTPKHICQLIGMEVSAFVGHSILESMDVLIDLQNNTIEFDATRPEGGCSIDLGFDGGLPVVKMTVNGRVLKAGFDTGAQYPFVLTELVEELNLGESIGQFPDFNPNLGHFTPDLYKGNIKIGECEFEAAKIAVHPKYDESVMYLDVEGFLGINCLIENKVKLWISYANEQMVIVK